MSANTVERIVKTYYESWVNQDLKSARSLLADNLNFVSPQDHFQSAEAFLSACGHYAEGIDRVEYRREVFTGNQAFVICEWFDTAGGSMASAEYLTVKDGRITEILVINNYGNFMEQLQHML